MGFSIKRSNHWAISIGASFGFVPLAGVTAAVLTLLDVEGQCFYNGCLGGSSVGFGMKAGGTISTFSPTFFKVDKPMFASDFDNTVCRLLDFSFVPGVGVSATGIDIIGVNHSPSHLDLSGWGAGLSAGVTLTPFMYLYIAPRATQNGGCIVAPTPDMLCGGFTKPEPRETTDTNRSGAR